MSWATTRRSCADLLKAGDESGEPGWELPLWKDYRRNIESTVADVKNIGPRWGGAITAGLFLSEFVGDVPWAHLDVAADGVRGGRLAVLAARRHRRADPNGGPLRRGLGRVAERARAVARPHSASRSGARKTG